MGPVMADTPDPSRPVSTSGPNVPAEGAGPGPRYDPTPLWVKVLAVIGAGLVLLAAVLLLGGGDHGPGRHLGAGYLAAGAGPDPAGGPTWR